MVGKKGYIYIIEIMFVVLLVTIFLLFLFPKSQTSHQKFQDENNLDRIGYGIIKNLDEKGILVRYLNEQTVSASNFTVLKTYMESSLPSTTGSKVEYAVNSTTCFSEFGAEGTCGANLTTSLKRFNVVRADYIFSKRPDPVTIRLF